MGTGDDTSGDDMIGDDMSGDDMNYEWGHTISGDMIRVGMIYAWG